MLGKLYISPTSTPDKLHAVHDLVNEAIEGRIASDAPSRNALNKLLTALTKAIGTSASGDATAKNDDDDDDGMTVVEVEVEDERGVMGEKMEVVEEAEGEERQAKDSILEELLDDEEEEEL